MRIYDSIIEAILGLLDGLQGRRLTPPQGEPWPDAGEHNLVLRGEMAYELGGGDFPAVGGFGLTASRRLVGDDELWLYGPDLPELSADAPYARLAFLRVAEDGLGDGDAAYAAIRKIEHTRYHISPEGFMTRISAARERETARVGKAALRNGLGIAAVGARYLEGYRRHPAVLAAKLVFITLPDFPYAALVREVRRAEAVTASLDHIFKNLAMDCSACNLKPVCDEVEGLRELHFSQLAR